MDEKAESVVRKFLESWQEITPDGHASWFADDGVFDDVPIGVHTGREAIRDAAAAYPSTTCEVLRMVSDDGVVVTERIDRFEFGGKPFALRAVGIFEVDDDGRVALQRDYYDMKGMLEALEAAGVSVSH